MSEEKHGRLAEAYDRMLERVERTLGEVGREAGPAVRDAVRRAEETAVELGELTRDEAQKVGYWLRRDLHDAGAFIAETGEDLGGWMHFDVELLEWGLAELLMSVADRTTVELDRIALEAEAFGEWHSGEVTAPGTFECKSCGEQLVINRTAHLPPCPRCKGTTFRRTSTR